MGANGVFCTKGVSCTSDKANKIENIEAGFITDRTTAFNLEQFEKFSKNGEIDTKSKTIILCNCLFMIHKSIVWRLVMDRYHFIEHQTNWNVIVWTSNECVMVSNKQISNSNLAFCDELNTILSNIEWTRTWFFELGTNSNVFIYWWSNLNTLFLAFYDRTSNLEPN